jgi:hypothetical protein
MKEEYNYNLTVPLVDLEEALELLELAQQRVPQLRISRKPDRKGYGRFYLSFPFKGSRTDIKFTEWFEEHNDKNWELFGPNYGVWGLSPSSNV